MSYPLLRSVLVARAVASAGFAWWLFESPPSFTAILPRFGIYAAVDGALALLMAALAVRSPVLRGGFGLVALLDGLWLVAAAVMLHLGPRIPNSALPLVLYVSLAAVCALFVGFLTLTAAGQVGRATGRRTLRVALSATGAVSVLIGAAAFFTTPDPQAHRVMLLVAAAVQAAALLAFAARGWPTLPLATRGESRA